MTAIKLYSDDNRDVLPGRLPSELHHSPYLIMAITFFWHSLPPPSSFPGGSDIRICLQCETWVQSLGWKIPWRRERLPTPVFWPWEFHGLYSPWVRGGHHWVTFTHSLPLLGVRGPLFPRKPQVVIRFRARPFKLPKIKTHFGHLLVTYFSVGLFSSQ